MNQQRKPIRPLLLQVHTAAPGAADPRGLLSREAAEAWMAAESKASPRHAAAPLADQVAELREHLGELEDALDGLTAFTDGLLVVLGNIVPTIVEGAPELAAVLHKQWGFAADRFEALQAGGPALSGESLDLLDARRLLFRLCAAAGLWPADGRGRA